MSEKQSMIEVAGSHRDLLPNSKMVGDVRPDERLQITILVRGASRPAVDAEFQGRRVDHEEFEHKFGAKRADLNLIYEFARSNGLEVTETNIAARTVKIEGPSQVLTKLFGVEIHYYESEGVRYRGRKGPVYVPQSLANIVVGIFGFDNRPAARMHLRRLENASVTIHPLAPPPAPIPGPTFTPPEVARLYTFPQGDGTGQVIGIIELGGGFQQSDLTAYFKSLGIPTPNVVVVSVDGGKNSPDTSNNKGSNPDFEVNLDIDVAGAIAPGAKQVIYFGNDTSDQSFLNAVKAAVHDSVNTPSVISISWGSTESALSSQLRNAMEQAFVDATALGITICVAAADKGSQDGVTDGKLHVDFPASAPHALAVGGTMLLVAGNVISSEVVWNNGVGAGATGGGVSDVFPLPSWQLTAGVPASSNPGAFVGRGVPDVACNADPNTGFQIFTHGKSWVFGGTSAGAPLWAALVAIINQRAGKNLGFFTSRLYTFGAGSDGLRDIVAGNNDNSGSVPALPFSAGAGWDACTGLGSPIASALMMDLLGFSVQIVEERDECGVNGVVPSGTARFWAKLSGVPSGASETYVWTVSGGGATVVGPTNSWSLQIKLGLTPNPVQISVKVTIEGVNRSVVLNYVPDTEELVKYRELLCQVRRVVQVNWWFDPLWDPLRDLVTHPYSPSELNRLLETGERLAALARNALAINASANAPKAFGASTS